MLDLFLKYEVVSIVVLIGGCVYWYTNKVDNVAKAGMAMMLMPLLLIVGAILSVVMVIVVMGSFLISPILLLLGKINSEND